MEIKGKKIKRKKCNFEITLKNEKKMVRLLDAIGTFGRRERHACLAAMAMRCAQKQ